MPGYKVIKCIAIGCWVTTTAALFFELFFAPLGPVFTYLVGVSTSAGVLASLRYMQQTAVIPVKEAFMHGYALATQHAAAATKAQQDPDLAVVLRPPTGAWTVNAQDREPVGMVSGDIRPAAHRASRPRRPSPRRS